ncbi:MAG TPA: peptidoglycan DD-metalloendopeptidase family protein [Stellaceae bacterium]|nr:peptidoglycan DD-metalloendopeptidase family protein [Stellaceae bacterium]
MLTGLAACGPRTEPPAPVTIHADHDALRTPPQESSPPVQRDSAATPTGTQKNSEARAGNNAPVVAPLNEPARVGNGQITAQNGDTLYAISRRTGVPVRDLIDANNLDPPFTLTTGQQLTVPQQRRHVVKAGDTLYSIANQYGVDVSTLASANALQPPYTVRVGDSLLLPAAPEQVAAVPPPPEKPQPPGTTSPPPEKSSTATTNTPAKPEGPLPAPPPRGGNFLWPVKGKVIERYGAGPNGTHNDGINIAAPKDAPVRSADAGVVAYAGNELKGYGNLLLIKHAGGWMTAYAHNDVLLVKRGETVKRGQEIAKVGSTGVNGPPQLHFEIRRGTKALDPDQYLSATQARAIEK